MKAPLPKDEDQRLETLKQFNILDTPPEKAFDDLATLASQICDAPIALMTLIDRDRQWFKAKVGLNIEQTSRDIAFCAHAILEPDQVTVVPDALADERFADNSLVTDEPHIRFYAGAPLVASDGQALGTLCVLDRVPRQLTDRQLMALQALRRSAISELELRRKTLALEKAVLERDRARQEIEQYNARLETLVEERTAELRASERRFRVLIENSSVAISLLNAEGILTYDSAAAPGLLGYLPGEYLGRNVFELIHPDDLPEIEHLFDQLLHRSVERVDVQLRVRHKDDSWRWLDTVGTNMLGDPAIQSIVLNYRDVTALKEAKLAAEASEWRLRQVMNAAPFGAHVYELRSDGRLALVGANHAADLMLHRNHDQLLEKTLEEIFPSTVQTDLPSVFRRVASEMSRLDIDQFDYEDGLVKATFEIHAVHLGSNRLAAFFRDITELAKAYDETLAGWSRALDARDKETEGHSQRVTEMTLRLAQALGTDEDQMRYLRWGALLHDMGKMGIPDSILLKPGKLTEEEWVIMRRHPQIALEMLSPIEFLRPALDIPYCHHEKWDGTGYPRGLKGEQIPRAARIFAAADVWDALSHDRPYRPAWPFDKVREHIREEAGRHFDPQVVAAFLDMTSK